MCDNGCLFGWGAYKRDVIVGIKMGAYVFSVGDNVIVVIKMGAYFLWVTIIPSLLYTRKLNDLQGVIT